MTHRISGVELLNRTYYEYVDNPLILRHTRKNI